MRARRLASALIATLAVGAVVAIGSAGTFSAFVGTTSNSGNSFEAAASFSDPILRMASGTYTGNSTNNRAIAAGFQPDLVIIKGNSTQNPVARTSSMTGDATKPLVGITGLTTNLIKSLTATGFTTGTDARVNTNSTLYQWVAFQAAAGALKVGSYTGNGGASQAVTGAGFAPEYVAVLGATAQRASQRYTGMTRGFQFDADVGTATRVTSLDGSGFAVGDSAEVNASGTVYHYVAVNDVPGSIKAGSYTGNAPADNRNITGVGFQPDYVMVRAGDTATARESSGRPASLTGDSTLRFGAFANVANRVQALQADGFQVGNDAAVNANLVTYHHLAFKNSAGGCSLPSTETLNASADSWVDQGSASTNKGDDSVLKVTSKSPNLNTRALVQFNLPAAPAGCSLTSAKLRLNDKSPVAGRTIEAYQNAATWTENGVTWTNQPATTGSSATATTPSSSAYMEWTVTTQVQAMYDGANTGFKLRDLTENGAGVEQQFDSREAGSNQPQLVVTFG